MRIVERHRAVADGEFGSEENYLALTDLNAAQHAGLIDVAAQAQIRRGLKALRQRRAELNVRRCPDAHIELHAAQQARLRLRNWRRRRCLREYRADIAV